MKQECKIVLILLILITTINSNSYAQNRNETVKGEKDCVKQYDVIFDGYYGFPYLVGNLAKQVLADTFGITGAKNLNHLGGRIEYLVWDKVGFGAEFTYASLTINYKGTAGKVYTLRVDKKRILAKFNFHFATTEKLDPYITAGMGYSNTAILSNEPGVVSEPITIFPVAIRMGIGIRYFFTEMVGINAEVGIGGPLMQAGLSFKF